VVGVRGAGDVVYCLDDPEGWAKSEAHRIRGEFGLPQVIYIRQHTSSSGRNKDTNFP
jgi:hypothetical protein